MSDEISTALQGELLDDYFAEADEHLLGIRQSLIQLEGSVGKAQVDPKIVESLFHDFHSFKGISAIVGLAPAESIAHATEDFLRDMRSGKTPLSAKGLNVLMAAARKLEQTVTAFRLQKPFPGYDSLLADLKAQCGATAASPVAPAKSPPQANPSSTALLTNKEEARSRGLLLWKYTFTPSHELNGRGINVTTIREELLTIGEILNSAPRVMGQGEILFEFLVAARETPADIETWEAKGVTVRLAEQEEMEPHRTSAGERAALEEDAHNPFLAPSHVVRIDLKRLDDLMRITGEMVIQRSRLDTQIAQLNGHGARVDLRPVQEMSGGLGRLMRELRESITRVRLVPVAEIFARMPFVVRDLAQQTQKRVRLKLGGQDTAIDKYLIERLKDPLLHLVRNAFVHGVETPAERVAASKPEEATIELSASTAGDSVVINVRDDGRGINTNAILEQAKKLGLDIPEVVDPSSILQILCSSGFSTRNDADRAAGRGVGMAVVYSTVRELGGTLALESDEGVGTQFTLRLPVSLAIAEMLIVKSAGQTCAVPQSHVREILQTTPGQVQRANGIEVVSYRSGILPVVRLSAIFALASSPKPKMILLVITSERGSVGLLAEEILGQREVVVRGLRDPLIQVPGITGATELGDGKPVLILDGAVLTSGTVRPLDKLENATASNGFAHPH